MVEALLAGPAVILLGYFAVPKFLSRPALHFFLAHATGFEAAWRDRFFRPLTARIKFVTPNAVTGAGFALILVLLYLFRAGASFKVIFVFTLLAGFTDMLDGSLARNNGQVTKSGAVLDWSRDLLLALSVGYFLFSQGLLRFDFILWFFAGWLFLGLVRLAEFKVSGGNLFSAEEDYKFALDRIRLALAWYGVLLLMLLPYNILLGKLAEILILAAIAVSWLSLLFHSAHLRFLKEEKIRGHGEMAS